MVNSAVGSLSLAVTLATARAQLDVEQEADALELFAECFGGSSFGCS